MASAPDGHQRTAAPLPTTLTELVDEEAALRRQVGDAGVELEEVIQELQRRYTAISLARDDAAKRLEVVEKRAARGRMLLDHVTLPRTLAPWLSSAQASLARAEADDASSANDDAVSGAQMCRVAPTVPSQALGATPMSASELRAGMGEVASRGQSRGDDGGGYQPTDQPAASLSGNAVVPYATKGGVGTSALAVRPALTDVAVVRCDAVGGRALVAKRSYAPGALLFAEAPTVSFATDVEVLVASGALPPTLRRALSEQLLGADGRRAIENQRWDARLAVAVFAILAHWTTVAAAETEGEQVGKAAGGMTEHFARAAVMSLACPLQDLPIEALTSLDKFSRFVHAALPACYRKFESSRDRNAAEMREVRRGVGEASRVSEGHEAELSKLVSARAQASALDPVVAPYDDNPTHHPVPVSPITGAAGKASSGAAAAPSTEGLVPAWCTVSSEDIARLMLVVQCNAINQSSASGGANLSATVAAHATGEQQHNAAARGERSIQHLLYLTAAMEHSCAPNVAVVAHHLPNVESALFGYAAEAADSSTDAQMSIPNVLSESRRRRLFEVRALRPIAAGERLSITYVPLSLPRVQRIARARTQFYFSCACVGSCLGSRRNAAVATRAGHVPSVDLSRIGVAREGGLFAPHTATGDLISLTDAWAPVPAASDAALLYGREEHVFGNALSLEVPSGGDPWAAALQEASSIAGLVRESMLRPTSDRVSHRPLPAVHYTISLRFARVATAMVANPAGSDSNWRSAVSKLLEVAVALLTQLTALVPRSAPAARLLAAVTEAGKALDVLVDNEVVQAARSTPTVELAVGAVRLVMSGAAQTLVDSIAALAVLAVLANNKRDTAGEVWASMRDFHAEHSGGAHSVAHARAAALACDPAGDSLPSHLR